MIFTLELTKKAHYRAGFKQFCAVEEFTINFPASNSYAEILCKSTTHVNF